MADTQIVRAAVSDAPAVYTLPDSVEFTLKAVNALYEDNGAAVDWLPCVTILSDSGHVIARACDQAVKVTAGDDAEVSFFPGVKHAAAAAAASSIPFLILLGVNSNVPSVPVGDSDHGKFAASPVWTNHLAEWSFTLDGAGNIKQVDVDGGGIYHGACAFDFAAAAATFQKSCTLNMSPNVVETFNDPNYIGSFPVWQTEGLTRELATVTGEAPINTSGGYITVEPTTSVVAGVNFNPHYLFLVKHPLTT